MPRKRPVPGTQGMWEEVIGCVNECSDLMSRGRFRDAERKLNTIFRPKIARHMIESLRIFYVAAREFDRRKKGNMG